MENVDSPNRNPDVETVQNCTYVSKQQNKIETVRDCLRDLCAVVNVHRTKQDHTIRKNIHEDKINQDTQDKNNNS